MPHRYRTFEGCRVVDSLILFGEAWKKTHIARPQSVCGLQHHRCRVACAQYQFPDLVIGLVEGAGAPVGRQGE
jgi:hypothetical protein